MNINLIAQELAKVGINAYYKQVKLDVRVKEPGIYLVSNIKKALMAGVKNKENAWAISLSIAQTAILTYCFPTSTCLPKGAKVQYAAVAIHEELLALMKRTIISQLN
jgi:hypothetical protein